MDTLICPHCGNRLLNIRVDYSVIPEYYVSCSCGFKLSIEHRKNSHTPVTQIELNEYHNKLYKENSEKQVLAIYKCECCEEYEHVEIDSISANLDVETYKVTSNGSITTKDDTIDIPCNILHQCDSGCIGIARLIGIYCK